MKVKDFIELLNKCDPNAELVNEEIREDITLTEGFRNRQGSIFVPEGSCVLVKRKDFYVKAVMLSLD